MFSQPWCRHRFFLAVVSLVTAVFGSIPTAVVAQVVGGRLTNAETGEPLVAAYVVLAHDSIGEVARSVTDDEGIYQIPVPQDGRYSLRAELIGFDAPPTPVFNATLETPANVDYAVALQPVRLQLIENTGPRCELMESEPTLRAWNETLKALRAVGETERGGRLSLRARMYQRVSNSDNHIVRETDSIVEDVRETPFVKYPTEVVVERMGYALSLADGSRVFTMPEPNAFTQHTFVTNHCFWLTDGPHEGTISLRFRPRDTTIVDGLAGGFTLDKATAELRLAEFQLMHDAASDSTAWPVASLHFVPVTHADWFVESWKLRTPIVREFADSSSPTVLGFDDIGAHVLEVSDVLGEPAWSGSPIAVLYGTVFDSLENVPLQGGVVAVSGTRHWTQTDATGGFAMAGYWDGSYGIVFGHPRLDSLGFVSQPLSVALRRGSEASVSLAVPPLATVLERRCADLTAVPGRKMLVGVVRDEETRQPVSGARVSLARDLIPDEFQVFANDRSYDVAITDSLGMYTVCDVPMGVTISVSATAGDRQSDFERATFWEDAVSYGDGTPQSLQYPVGRLDLTVKPVAEYSGALMGTVTDDLTGFSIPDVVVSVEGTALEARTDSAGVFALRNLPGGPVRLNLRKLGYRMLRYTISTDPGDQLVLGLGTLTMVQADADAVTLDPILVEAEGVTPKLSEFEERRSRGFGSFLTKDDFEKWNPTAASDVLRRMRGVRVRPNPYYGVNGDTRRNVIEPSRDIGQRITRIITTNESRRTESGGGRIVVNECPMLLFLDGVYLGDTYESDVDNIISTTDLSAVEVYSPSQVPVQFALPGSTCGVVVFWSY